MIFLRNFFTIGGLLFFCILAHAKSVTLIHMDIPGLHNKTKTGKYDRLLAENLSRSGYADYSVEFYPPARAFSVFKGCADCCISPANFNSSFYPYTETDYTLTDKPMGIAKIYIWTLAQKGSLSELSDLAHKSVGARRGMPLGNKIDTSGIELELTNTIKQNIHKLQNKRIDAFIDYTPDVLMVLQSEGLEDVVINVQNAPLEVHPDHYVCKKSRKTSVFLKAFNGS